MSESYKREPTTPLLPIVGADVKHALFAETDDTIRGRYMRMAEVQPNLTEAMLGYIFRKTEDPYLARDMMEVMTLTYSMLENQAAADRLSSLLNGPIAPGSAQE